MMVNRTRELAARRVVRGAALGLVVAVVGLSVVGCSHEPPKPQAQPTHKDVRGDSDRFFDKLKQEERERGSKGTEGPTP